MLNRVVINYCLVLLLKYVFIQRAAFLPAIGWQYRAWGVIERDVGLLVPSARPGGGCC